MKSESQKAQSGQGVHITNEPGGGGLSRVDVRGAHATGSVYHQGAHVTSFCPEGVGGESGQAGAADDVLFVSEKSRFEPGAAIRGGVPICFPWFGPREGDGDAPMHGFARTTDWRMEREEHAEEGAVSTIFSLCDDKATRAVWPAAFEARLTVVFGAALSLTLEVRHAGQPSDEPITFEAALHTYLRVGEIRDVTIAGLTGATYIDKMDGMRRKVEETKQLSITGETDRVYQDTRAAVTVSDAALGREIVVEKEGSRSTVVWNPWIEKAARLADMEDDGWRRFVCIETANIGEHAVHLHPGQSHRMSALIRVGKL